MPDMQKSKLLQFPALAGIGAARPLPLMTISQIYDFKPASEPVRRPAGAEQGPKILEFETAFLRSIPSLQEKAFGTLRISAWNCGRMHWKHRQIRDELRGKSREGERLGREFEALADRVRMKNQAAHLTNRKKEAAI
jgi:hypothetical protein